MIKAQATDKPVVEDIWEVMLSRWRMIVLGALLGVGVALGLSLTAAPKFRSQVVLMPVARENGSMGLLGGGLGGLAALAGLSPKSDMRAEALATLESRSLTEAFIRSQNLMPLLFPKKWDSSGKAWKIPAEQPSFWKATEYFKKKVMKVEEDRKTSLVTLTIDWIDPQTSAIWANKLVAMGNETLRLKAKLRAEKNAGFLQDQLNKTSVIETRKSIYTLLESEIKTIMLTENDDEYAFKVVDAAVAPDKPISPNIALWLLVGFASGSGSCIFFSILLGSKSRSRGD